jgi:uncharacterized DUF497 family protein
MAKNPLVDCVGFEWDEWNSGKNWERHRVTPEEAEEVFFHDPCVLKSDSAHSATETRYGVLGQTVLGPAAFHGIHGSRQVNSCNFCAGYESKGRQGVPAT